MAGLMAGNFVFSHLSDWFGRKPLLGICIVVQVVFNLLLLLAPTYTWILVITFITACGYGGLQNIPFTLGEFLFFLSSSSCWRLLSDGLDEIRILRQLPDSF